MEHRKTPNISNAELWILRELWKNEPLDAKELVARLGAANAWNPRTVKTLIHRLVKKGALSFVDTGKGYLYSPVVTEKECIEAERNNLLKKVPKTHSLKLIAAFIENVELSRDEIDELKQLIEKKG